MFSSAKFEKRELLVISPLCIAIQLDNLQLVKKLIEKEVNPLDEDEDGYTLLHFAAEAGRLNILKYLVEEVGCNPAVAGNNTTLHAAAYSNQLHIVKYLIEQCQMDCSASDDSNITPLSYACLQGEYNMARYLIKCMSEHMKMEDILYSYSTVIAGGYAANSHLGCACIGGNLSIVKYLVEECNCDPFRPELGKKSVSPLILTASFDHLHIMKYLVQMQNDVHVTRLTNESEALIPLAVHNHSFEMIKFLIERLGCDPNCKYMDKAPVQYAVRQGDLDIIKYLLIDLKCDPCAKDSSGIQPIHVAAGEGHLHVVKYLIEKQQCNPSALDNKEITPLAFAADYGHLSIVRYLTLKHHCNPLRPSLDSRNSLHRAASCGYTDIVRFFVEELKCDPNSYIKTSGETLLTTAAHCGHLSLVSYLLEIGSEHHDQIGLTPLDYAAAYGHLHIVKYLTAKYKILYSSTASTSVSSLIYATVGGHLKVVKYLLEDQHYSKHIVNSHGETLVHTAAAFGHIEIVKYLVIDMKCDPSIKNKRLLTPLDHACSHGHLDIVKLFVEKMNCDLKACNEDGTTPFHIAVKRGHLKIVKYLVDKLYCDVNSMNKYNNTPLHYAASNGHLDIIRYLTEKKAKITWQDDEGNTSLHFAAENNHLEVVMFLTSKVDNFPSIVNHFQKTPLDIALQSDSEISVSALYLIVVMFNHL